LSRSRRLSRCRPRFPAGHTPRPGPGAAPSHLPTLTLRAARAQFFVLTIPETGVKGAGLPYGAWYCSDTATSAVLLPAPQPPPYLTAAFPPGCSRAGAVPREGFSALLLSVQPAAVFLQDCETYGHEHDWIFSG
jgi:hypothetical protein